MFETLLENWEEPTKRGRRYPYIALARKERVDVHLPKVNEKDPDRWAFEEREIVSILDVSDNHADAGKLRYYIKKGMTPIKWFLPLNGKHDEDSNRTSYADLLEICQREQEIAGMRLENIKLKAEKSVMDQRVDEAKERSGRKTSKSADQAEA